MYFFQLRNNQISACGKGRGRLQAILSGIEQEHFLCILIFSEMDNAISICYAQKHNSMQQYKTCQENHTTCIVKSFICFRISTVFKYNLMKSTFLSSKILLFFSFQESHQQYLEQELLKTRVLFSLCGHLRGNRGSGALKVVRRPPTTCRHLSSQLTFSKTDECIPAVELSVFLSNRSI